MTLSELLILVSAITVLGCYIALKASGEFWYGINWKFAYKQIKKWFRNHK